MLSTTYVFILTYFSLGYRKPHKNTYLSSILISNITIFQIFTIITQLSFTMSFTVSSTLYLGHVLLK